MRSFFLCILFMSTLNASFSQSGKNQIGIGPELAFPTGDFGRSFNTGFGGYFKLLFGIQKTGQITFSSGYTNFRAKGSGSEVSASVAIIPVLLGIRAHLNRNFYIEPQAGYGSYNARVRYMGQNESGSSGGFTYAFGMGMTENKVEVGLRYQGSSVNNTNFGNFAVRFGYNFDLRNR